MADCKERGLDETLETIAQEYHLSLRSTYEAERTTAVVRAARVRMWKQLTSRMWTLNEVARFFSLDYGTIKSHLAAFAAAESDRHRNLESHRGRAGRSRGGLVQKGF